MEQSDERDSYNEYMRKYMKGYRERRKAEAIAALGGHCVDCGSTENLEFDHIDREAKAFTIGDILAKSKARLDAELEKCVLRCRNCHVGRTREQLGFTSRHEHGTIASYSHGACRCDDCRLAWSVYNKARRPTKRPRGVEPEHGTPSRYRKGCRCAACRAANAERNRKYKVRSFSGQDPGLSSR